MLKISKLADYSIVILSQMALQPQSYMSARQLAAKSFLPVPTVSKILKVLLEAGLVISKKGAAGGYRLLQPAGEVSLLAVVEAIDGPLTLTDCNKAVVSCSYMPHCKLQHSWQVVNQIVARVLSQLSIVDMMGHLRLTPGAIEDKLTAVINQFSFKEYSYHD